MNTKLTAACKLTILGLGAMLAPWQARACDYHWAVGIPEPVGLWPTLTSAGGAKPVMSPADLAVAQIQAQDAINDAAVTGWMINTTNAKGHSTNATINATVSQIKADVDTVAYDATNVYVHASDIPSHDIGPFPGNPATPTNRNRTMRIPRAPVVNTGTKTAVGLGPIGVMVNGVSFFDPRDNQSYNNQGVWHQNANVFEASGFDGGPGHPAPDMQSQTTGSYHYHQAPVALINQRDPGNTGQHASPLLGFAFDGFPIYGPYGYANTDGTGGIVKEASSYVKRSITTRTTLPNGQNASSAGPAVSAQYPLGSYIEDYAYSAGAGTLDQYNGRFSGTPDYPQGTYAYYVALDATNTAVYPYIIGPSYYGVVDTGNLGPGNITVPGNVTYYTPSTPEPGTAMLLCAAGMILLRRSRKAR